MATFLEARSSELAWAMQPRNLCIIHNVNWIFKIFNLNHFCLPDCVTPVNFHHANPPCSQKHCRLRHIGSIYNPAAIRTPLPGAQSAGGDASPWNLSMLLMRVNVEGPSSRSTSTECDPEAYAQGVAVFSNKRIALFVIYRSF